MQYTWTNKQNYFHIRTRKHTLDVTPDKELDKQPEHITLKRESIVETGIFLIL